MKKIAGLEWGSDAVHKLSGQGGSEVVTSEQKSERSQGQATAVSQKKVPDGRNDNCKDPEAGI